MASYPTPLTRLPYPLPTVLYRTPPLLFPCPSIRLPDDTLPFFLSNSSLSPLFSALHPFYLFSPPTRVLSFLSVQNFPSLKILPFLLLLPFKFKGK